MFERFLRKVTFFIIILALLIFGKNVLSQESQNLFPYKIGYGIQVKISYDLKIIEKNLYPAEIKDVNLLLFTNPIEDPEKIPMEQDKSVWTAKITINDTSTKMIFWAYEIITATGEVRKTFYDNKNRKYGDGVMCNANGTPVGKAFMERALSFTGAGRRREENIDQAVKDIETEIKLYPNNTEARILFYSFLLKQNNKASEVAKQIEKDIKDLSLVCDSLKVEKFALKAYKLIGDKRKTSEIEKKLIKEYPKGDVAARKDFEDAIKIKDTTQRMEKLEDFLKNYSNSPMEETAVSGIASAAIELDDTLKMMEIGDRLFKNGANPSAARALAGIAGALSEKRIRLSRALAYIKKALDLLNSAKSMTMPPEIDKDEWQERTRITEGRYRDILGWIMFINGKREESLKHLSQAVKYTRQPGVYFHYGVVLSNMGKKEDALKWYARASVFGGEVSDSSYAALVELWKYLGKPEDKLKPFIKNIAEELKASYSTKVLSHRHIKPAPDFELETLDHNWVVTLADQKGSVVLLCFWATWSRSSGIMLSQLNELSENWGDTALFLTIATDKNPSRIENYVNKRKILLPVLLNDDTDKSYKVQGVPTLFVIDKKGNINFIHKGFSSDLRDVLAVEINDLLK